MTNVRNFLAATGIIVATTIGAGIFALPYVFQKAGFPAALFYFFVLGACIVYINYLYWRTLLKIREKERLLGLVKHYFGGTVYRLAFLSVVPGLFLFLVTDLILAGRFINSIFPGSGAVAAIAAFWIVASFPIVLKLPRFAFLESVGALLMLGLIAFVFATSGMAFRIPAAIGDFRDSFFSFGVILFALASWPAVEPVFDLEKKRSGFHAKSALAAGTAVSALFYLIFVLAMFASAAHIAPDTVSGLANWPFWKLATLAWLGLFAIWTSYLPIALEIKNSLEKDLGWHAKASVFAVVVLPLSLVFLGLNNFFALIGVSGGVFLALQHVFIILAGKKILDMRFAEKLFLHFLVLLFLAAAAYEVYIFVVPR